jgi:sec-independent protein translocase protein TatB
MFGMGFMEIFLILIVAIVALGPEKLPSAVVDVAKFFKKLKGSIDDAKTTIDNELSISEMKKQANEFKASMGDVSNMARVDLNTINSDRIYNDDDLNIEIIEKTHKTHKTKKEEQEINEIKPQSEKV